MHYCSNECTGDLNCKLLAIKYIDELYPVSPPHQHIKSFLQSAIDRESCTTKEDYEKHDVKLATKITLFKMNFSDFPQFRKTQRMMMQEFLKPFISENNLNNNLQ